MELSLLALLIIILAALASAALATYYLRTASEEQIRKSCQAKAAEQATLYRAELKTLQAMSISQAGDIGALEREKRSLEARQEDLAARHAAVQQEKQSLKKRLQKAEELAHSNDVVQTAHVVKEQWQSISKTLARAGFVAKNPKDLASSIEKLEKLRELSVAPPDQASLTQQELAGEKAAKEAALDRVKALSERLDDEKNRADNLQKELEKAQKTTTEGSGDTTRQQSDEPTEATESARATIAQQAFIITVLGAELDKRAGTMAAMASAISEAPDTTVGNLQLELRQAHYKSSRIESDLNNANATIRDMRSEGQELLMQYNKLEVEYHSAIQAAHKLEEEAKSAKDQLKDENSQELLAQYNKLEHDYKSAVQAAHKHEEDAKQARAQLQDKDSALVTLQKTKEKQNTGLENTNQTLLFKLEGRTAEVEAKENEIQTLQSKLARSTAAIEAKEKETQSLLANNTAVIKAKDNQIASMTTTIQGLRSPATTAVDQQTSGDTQANPTTAEPPALRSAEAEKLRLAFQGEHALALSEIVCQFCPEYLDASNGVEIELDSLPIHLQYHLLGYIRGAKVNAEPETNVEPETIIEPATKVERIIKPLKSARQKRA